MHRALFLFCMLLGIVVIALFERTEFQQAKGDQMREEEKRKRAAEIRDNLAQFTGTAQWHRHMLVRKVVYTDGVHYLAENAEAFWLIDKIAAMQLEPMIAAEPFQTWKLALMSDDKAVLTCTDGGKEGREPGLLHKEHITFTDFPLDEIELWVGKEGEHYIIMLPTEY